jgi:hypothetical protein
VTWKAQILPSELFIGYISVFVAGYAAGKGLEVIRDNKEDKG